MLEFNSLLLSLTEMSISPRKFLHKIWQLRKSALRRNGKKKKTQNRPQGVGLLSRLLLGIFVLNRLMRKTPKQRRVNIDLI